MIVFFFELYVPDNPSANIQAALLYPPNWLMYEENGIEQMRKVGRSSQTLPSFTTLTASKPQSSSTRAGLPTTRPLHLYRPIPNLLSLRNLLIAQLRIVNRSRLNRPRHQCCRSRDKQ